MIIVMGATGGLGGVLAAYDQLAGHAVVPVLGRKECDLTSEGDIARTLPSLVLDNLQAIHVINCVGVSMSSTLGKLDDAQASLTLEVNLLGPMLLLKHLAPLVKERPGSSVTFLSSVTARMGVAGTAAYSASKAGLHGLVRVAAQEFARYHCRVNALELGYFDAGLIRQVPTEVLLRMSERVALKRLGSHEEFVKAVEFVIGCGYVNGAIIPVDGGLV